MFRGNLPCPSLCSMPPVLLPSHGTHLSLTTLMVLTPVAFAIWMTAWPTPLLAAFWMTESPGEQSFGAAVTAGAAVPSERRAGGPCVQRTRRQALEVGQHAVRRARVDAERGGA